MRSSDRRSAQYPVDSSYFFFSFEFSYLRAAKKPRLAGAPEVGTQLSKKLLLSAHSLCRMVLRGLERLAAPPH
jgi:hypothetical protein